MPPTAKEITLLIETLGQQTTPGSISPADEATILQRIYEYFEFHRNDLNQTNHQLREWYNQNAETLNRLIGLYINQNLATDDDINQLQLQLKNLATELSALKPLSDPEFVNNTETLNSLICDELSGQIMKTDDYEPRISQTEFAVQQTLPKLVRQHYNSKIKQHDIIVGKIPKAVPYNQYLVVNPNPRSSNTDILVKFFSKKQILSLLKGEVDSISFRCSNSIEEIRPFGYRASDWPTNSYFNYKTTWDNAAYCYEYKITKEDLFSREDVKQILEPYADPETDASDLSVGGYARVHIENVTSDFDKLIVYFDQKEPGFKCRSVSSLDNIRKLAPPANDLILRLYKDLKDYLDGKNFHDCGDLQHALIFFKTFYHVDIQFKKKAPRGLSWKNQKNTPKRKWRWNSRPNRKYLRKNISRLLFRIRNRKRYNDYASAAKSDWRVILITDYSVNSKQKFIDLT